MFCLQYTGIAWRWCSISHQFEDRPIKATATPQSMILKLMARMMTDINAEEVSVDANENEVANDIFHAEGDDKEAEEDQDEGEKDENSEDEDNEIAPARFTGYSESDLLIGSQYKEDLRSTLGIIMGPCNRNRIKCYQSMAWKWKAYFMTRYGGRLASIITVQCM